MELALKTKIQDMMVKNHLLKLEEKKDEIETQSETTNVEEKTRDIKRSVQYKWAFG